MADEDQELAPYQGHVSGRVDPQLNDFVNAFQGSDAQHWAAGAAARIQQHLTMRAVAERNQQMGDQFVQNLHEFKQNMVDMVKGDPSSAGLALDLIPHTIKAMAAEHEGMDPEQRDAAANDLINHMSGEVAHATVQSLAEKNDVAARTALASPRLAGFLGDDDKTALGTYIDNQAYWRQQDGIAAQQQAQFVANKAGYDRTTAYLGKLIDPDTGGLQLPSNFGQTVMSDTNISNPASAALHRAYSMLQANGDPKQSHPEMIADFFNRAANGAMPSQAELLYHVGSNLTLADAQMLNSQLGPRTPAQQQDTGMINDTIQNMRSQLLTPENGPAGPAAFGRFTSWFLPALRNGIGPDVPVANLLDPDHADTILDQLPKFQPGPQDALSVAPPVADRPSLGQIFAGNVQPLRPLGTNTGEVPGATGDVLDRMQQRGDTSYSTPGTLPVTRTPVPDVTPANEAQNQGPDNSGNA